MRKRIGLLRTGMELKDESEELDYDYTLTLNADGTGQFDGDRIRAKVIGVDLVFEKQ